MPASSATRVMATMSSQSAFQRSGARLMVKPPSQLALKMPSLKRFGPNRGFVDGTWAVVIRISRPPRQDRGPSSKYHDVVVNVSLRQTLRGCEHGGEAPRHPPPRQGRDHGLAEPICGVVSGRIDFICGDVDGRSRGKLSRSRTIAGAAARARRRVRQDKVIGCAHHRVARQAVPSRGQQIRGAFHL